RYGRGDELAEDLRRYLAGEPILARPVSAPERASRWCRRNPWLAGTAAAFVLSLLGGMGFSLYYAKQANDRADDANRQMVRANENAEKEKAAKEKERTAKEFAAEQGDLALQGLGKVVTNIQARMIGDPALQDLRQVLVESVMEELKKVAKSAEDSTLKDRRIAQLHLVIGDTSMM